MLTASRYVFLILICCCISRNVNANVTNIQSYVLNWNDSPQELTIGDSLSYDYITFDKAVINQNIIPVLQERYKTERSIVDIKITQEKYESIPANLQKFVDIKALNQDFSVSFYINKSRNQSYLNIEIIPIRINKSRGILERLVSFNLETTFNSEKNLKKATATYKDNSVLKTGNWYKFKIPSSGIYQITFNQLSDIGFSNPSNVAIYGLGCGLLPEIATDNNPDDLKEIPVQFSSNSIIVYLKGPNIWNYDTTNLIFRHKQHDYSDYAYYFITDIKKGQSLSTLSSVSGTVTNNVSTFQDYSYHELDLRNLISSGREWYGEYFGITSTDLSIDFEFPNLVKSTPIHINTHVLSRSRPASSFSLRVNNSALGTYSLPSVVIDDYLRLHASSLKISEYFTSNSDDITMQLKYNPYDSNSKGYLNYIEVNATRQLIMEGSEMSFRETSSVGLNNITRFTLQNASDEITVLDVTDIYNPYVIEGNTSGSNYQFTLRTDSLREFIAYKTSNLKTPVLEGHDLGFIKNQDLHGLTPPDYLIITHNNFKKYANDLASLHKKYSGLDVAVVEQHQVFNEFSSGTPDVSALRNFIKMFYDKSGGTKPRYLLLFGDGSYDNKNEHEYNYNYILTYQSQESLEPTTTFVSDDFFGILDDNESIFNGLVDIGIGRIPVHDTLDAKFFVNKIATYLGENTFGDWRNSICFVGDDEDNNSHMQDAENLSVIAQSENASTNVNKIFLDAYKQKSTSAGARYPDVNTAIFNQLEKGALIVNYSGHGGEYGLAHERILTDTDVNNWSNSGKFPVFLTATCEFSRFDLVSTNENGEYTPVTTTGENVVLARKAGAIASLTTTRVVFQGSNFLLNQEFYRNAFEKNADFDERNRLGDIVRLTKNALSMGTSNNKRKFALLGDPALIIAYPEHKIVIDSINGNHINDITDTLGALSYVTIAGHVEYINGGLFENFNGELSSTIYDKPENISTLDNDRSGNPFQFKLQQNIIFKGKATVKNGQFRFSFLIPKDISYLKGKGKISCYAHNNETDAAGCDTSIIIGGFNLGTEIEDNEGPEIEMYMNTSYYRENGITNESPTLLAYISDENGINTTTSGIGHEMIGILDNNFSTPITMNDFYEASADDYTKGTINYPLLNLEPGEHTIRLKVWDVLNNSGEKNLKFYVKESNKFTIQNVHNYPNPFKTTTSFYIEHNLPGELLEIEIFIYNMTGELITILENNGEYDGYMSQVFTWDGKNKKGADVSDGLYLGRVVVHSEKGTAEKSAKLLLIR